MCSNETINTVKYCFIITYLELQHAQKGTGVSGRINQGYYTGPQINEFVYRMRMEMDNKGSLQQVLIPSLSLPNSVVLVQ